MAEADEPRPGTFPLQAAIEQLERIAARPPRPAMRLVVRISNPGGLSGHQTVDATAIHAGFDWEAGRVVIETAKPLCAVTQEDLQAIRKSVAAGQSWHAYQVEKRRLEQLATALGVPVTSFEAAMAEIAKLRGAQAQP